MEKVLKNNQASIIGEVVKPLTFSHEVFGEGFYSLYIQVGRLSESYDVIPLMVSERLMDVKKEAALRATSLYMLLLITASGTLQALYTSRVQPYHVAYLASTSAW